MTLLGLLETSQANFLIEHYARLAEVDVDVVESFMRALDYKADRRLVERVIGALKSKASTYFWKREGGGSLYVASDGLLPYVDVLPISRRILFDGTRGLDMGSALRAEWRSQSRITDIILVEPSEFVFSMLGGFNGLKTLTFVRAFIDDFGGCGTLRRLKTIRLIDSEVADWQSLEYTDIDNLYLSGATTAAQVYHDSVDIRTFAKNVYVSNGFIWEIERLQARHGFDRDTWKVQTWAEGDVKAFEEEAGLIVN
jgi:hypothetical protein